MEINDSFRVNRPIDDAWKVLLDIERIAPCLPGAELQEVEGDEYRGVVKVKVGPITAQYKGTAKLAEVDEGARRIVLDASGRDTRGQGNAKAKIVVTMREDTGSTEVGVDTDLSITGKVAQFGRGVMADVSAKLIRQFVENLERDVLSDQEGVASATEADATETPTGSAAGAATAAPETGPRTIQSRPAEPVDLLGVAGAPVTKRLVPVGIALVVVLVLWRVRRRRSRAKVVRELPEITV
jgi:carbon monoxide dehydrogenase subunit G